MSLTSLHEKERRTDALREDYSDGKRVYDPKQDMDVVKIFSGGWHVSKENIMLATILGSCIAACIRDPIAKVGGMNHFLLPGEDIDNQVSDAARYGVFSMECLINAILKQGGSKHRLEIKVFGGGNVLTNSSLIGSMNARFIRNFLRREGYEIVSEDLEGTFPRRVHYYPQSGKVMLRHLRRASDRVILEEEANYTRVITSKPIEGNIELF